MIIAYNSHNSNGRIKFSLMHELGHHILEHAGGSELNEQEANAFASCILVTRMAIHYSKCKDAEEVSKIFCMSYDAAAVEFDEYRRWHRRVATYKMTHIDRVMYGHFYNTEKDCFVWSVKECNFCGAILYNSSSDHCKSCCIPDVDESQIFVKKAPLHNIDMGLFYRLENRWLYGGL